MSSLGHDTLNWAIGAFGAVAVHPHERVARFLEEALELAHALGLADHVADRLRQRVWSRPTGAYALEAAQTQLTLDTLCAALGVDAHTGAAKEFARIKDVPAIEWRMRHIKKLKEGLTADTPLFSNPPAGSTPALRLRQVVEECHNNVSGAEEDRGRDTLLSELIAIAEGRAVR